MLPETVPCFAGVHDNNNNINNNADMKKHTVVRVNWSCGQPLGGSTGTGRC